MPVTFIDGILLCVLLFYAVEGYAVGGIGSLFNIANLFISLAVAFTFYTSLSTFFSRIFSISQGISHAISFFILACFVGMVVHLLLKIPQNAVSQFSFMNKSILRIMNKILGISVGVIQGGVFLSFFLTMLLLFPVSTQLKNSINVSLSGKYFLSQTQLLEQAVKKIFGSVATDMLTFTTVEENSKTSVNLHFTVLDGKISSQDEQEMFILLNKERKKNNKEPLIFATDVLQQIARAHGKDMLQRGYFSHYTPEGLSPFDRMAQATITYSYAGENLAFSPSVALAMQGLMNSKGHRENMLSSLFHHVGIGVIDGGKYGKMFIQEFTDVIPK